MNKLSWVLWTLCLMFTACSSNESNVTTKSGVVVNYLTKGEGPSPAQGEVMSVHMSYSDQSGNVLFETKEIGAPVPMMCDTAGWKEAGMLYEVMSLLKIGDSVSFDIPVDDLFTKSFRAQKPDSIPSESKFSFIIGLESAMSPEAYNNQRNSGQLTVDAGIIDAYLSENNIEAETTGSGLRYVISQTGTGPNATAGNQVDVHYNGTLLDGTKFDSSYDRGQPFSFVLGQGRVIQGWDEGIALLNKGAKATLYIPSSLGYGERGSPPVIPSNAVLKFDVELVDFQ